MRGAIRTMRVGEWYARSSLIRRPTRLGRSARAARYRWYRTISSGLPVIVAGRRWCAPNTSPRSAVPNRSPSMSIRPQSWRICGCDVPQGPPNVGASRWHPRSVPDHASRSHARSIARFAHNQCGFASWYSPATTAADRCDADIGSRSRTKSKRPPRVTGAAAKKSMLARDLWREVHGHRPHEGS